MSDQKNLVPANILAQKTPIRFPNESSHYRTARTALLAEEIELRRHIERVAELRRALPPGGEVIKEYKFVGAEGPVNFSGLFGDKPTLVAYSFMYGPEQEKPCPMCTSLLSAWAGEARDVGQRVSLVVIARAPIEKLLAFAKLRGWKDLRIYSDSTGEYSRDYFGVTPDGNDIPALNVFSRANKTVRHFWSGEMTSESADPGQDARGAPDLMPIWTILDSTPEGRGTNWYPQLEYASV